MRILHVFLILALVLSAPLQAASSEMVCASGAAQDSTVQAHSEPVQDHAHGGDGHTQQHGAAPADASLDHVCTGACAEPCGSACCQCAQFSAMMLFGVSDLHAGNARAVSPAPSVDGRPVGTEHRPPKPFRS